MKKYLIFANLFLLIFVFGAHAAFSQFMIKIPKIKPDKPKTEQSNTGNPTPNGNVPPKTQKSGGGAIYKNDRPTNVPVLIKDSIELQTVSHDEYWKMKGQRNFSSWVPAMRFRLFYNNVKPFDFDVEYYNPDGSLWFAESMERSAFSGEGTVGYGSPSPWMGVLDTKSTNAVGVFSFKIINRETKQPLYQGKFKIGKFSASGDGREKNKFDFYVDHDWLLTFGTIGFHYSDIEIGGVMPEVNVWLNGLENPDELEGRLYFQSRQIATTKEGGVSSVTSFVERTSRLAPGYAPEKIWKRWRFQWNNFRFDNNGGFNRDYYPNAHYADKNPGEYTVKILRGGAPIRELSFTVGADGRFVEPSWTSQIPLPYHHIVLPVKVIVAAEKVNGSAWKTDAFYGNPLNGFGVQ